MDTSDSTGVTWQVSFGTRLFTGLPESLAAAFRIPGSTSTRFSEGAYVVGSFNRNKADFELPSGLNACAMAASRPLVGTNPALYIGYQPNLGPALGSPQATNVPFVYTHLDYSGTFCTGLAPEANFTVTLKAGLEILPNSSSVLVDFISPTVPHNPKLEQLYETVVSQMPPSVPVADNDAGDWFKRVIKIAAPIASKIFPTAAPVINAGAGLATKGIGAIQQRRETKKKQKSVVKKPTRAEIQKEINRLTNLLRSA